MSEAREQAVRYSVVIPVGRRVDYLATLVTEYAEALGTVGEGFELIVVLDGPKRELLEALKEVAGRRQEIRIIELAREFGESAALTAGFDAARGKVLVTLPAYYQVEPRELPRLLAAAEKEDDMLIAVRWPRIGSFIDRLRRGGFHALFKFVSGTEYRDLGCGVRLLKREVAAEIPLYGDQHRFLPALATKRGFRVREVELAQSPKDMFRGRYRLREYLHGVLDVLTIFFLVRFTKKPLRFFGTIGVLAAGIGGTFVLVMVIQRAFFGVGLADRPALLLASLLVVLGVQTFALGLVGELIIFTHASDMKEYAVRSIIQGRNSKSPQGESKETASVP